MNAPSVGYAGLTGRVGRAVETPEYAFTAAGVKVRRSGRHAFRAGFYGLFVVGKACVYGRGVMAIPSPAPSCPPSEPGRRLAPFEHLMLVDARPGFPMCFFLECLVGGPLDEARFRTAVAEAARRHPLVRSRVGVRGSRPYWLPPDVDPEVVWHPRTDDDPWAAIDVTRQSGLRLVVLPVEPGRHRVVMQVHHAACDGIAACEYFGDIWAAYAGLAPRAFSPGRATPVVADAAGPTAATPLHGAAPLEFARFMPSPLARVAASPPNRAAEICQPPYETLQCDAVFTERLRVAAGRQGVSLNDVLVAAVMRAAVAWNTAAGRGRSNVRVTMPVSLRAAGSRQPARNAIGYAFLDRRSSDCAAMGPLAASIGAATKWVLDTGAAAAFLAALDWLARRPRLLWIVTRLPVCCATAVFSNVGDTSRRMRTGAPKVDGRDAPADLVIEQFLGVPPLRPRTLAAVGGTTYANALALSCLCAAAADGRHAAAAFLALVQTELEAFTAAS